MRVLQVNKEDLKFNLNLIKNKILGKSKIIAVVKANGMGLDLMEYTKFLIEEGIEFFGVSVPDDAITLRKNKIDKDILLMSEVSNNEELTDLIKNDIILTIGNIEEKEKIELLAKRFARFRFII